jgi:hypothetical protein
MKTPKILLVLLAVAALPFLSRGQKPPTIPRHDSVSFDPEDSVYKYYQGDQLVLWKSYRNGSMSYLPGAAIGGGHDSAYLYYTKGKMILYTYNEGTTSLRILSPYSLSSSTQSTYKGKIVGSGKYLLHRDEAYYPQWLNMPLQPVGVWTEWNSWFKTSKRKNYDTVLKVSPKATYAIGSIQRILQGANELLREKLGDSIVSNYLHLSPWWSSLVGIEDGEVVYPLLPEANKKTKALGATLTYEVWLTDSLRFPVITIRVDSLGRLLPKNFYEPADDLPSAKPQARYFNRAYLLKRAASYGIKNDHRIFWKFYLEYTDKRGKIEILYLTNPGVRGAEDALYKQLIIDVATGQESFNPRYQVRFETVEPPAER